LESGGARENRRNKDLPFASGKAKKAVSEAPACSPVRKSERKQAKFQSRISRKNS